MFKKIKEILCNRVAKNASWIIGGKIIQMGMNLIVNVLVARYLGPTEFGFISYAGAYTAFFSSICTLGIDSVIVKELIDNSKKEGEVLGTSLFLRLLSSTFSTLTIMGIAMVVDAGQPVTQLVVILSSLSCIFQVFDTFTYWFQARLQSKVTTIATILAVIITSGYKVILLIAGMPVTYFAVALSIDYICLAIFFYISYKKYGGGKLSISLGYAKSILKKSYHFILPGLMVSVYAQTDKLMLKHMISDAEIGYYSTAVSLCSAWTFVLSAIIVSLTPSIMESFDRDRLEFDRKNKFLYSIVFYVSIVVAIGFTIFADLIIYLMYGVAYAPAAAPLRIITWYTAFSYLGVARNPWIVCMNRQKYLKYIYVSAAVLNVILNLIFIPWLGAVGAAIASLAAQILTSMVIPCFIKEMRENVVLMGKAILFR